MDEIVVRVVRDDTRVDLAKNTLARQHDVPSSTVQTTGTGVMQMTLNDKVASSSERRMERVPRISQAEERADLAMKLFVGSVIVRRMRGEAARLHL